MVTCAVAERPCECCGLIVGTAGRAHAVWPARNVAEPPTARYRVDPADHFAALRYARARGLDVIGAYHSHPRTAAVPSERDRHESLTDFVYVIVGPLPSGDASERVHPAAPVQRVPSVPLTAWWLVDGNFVEIRLVPE